MSTQEELKTDKIKIMALHHHILSSPTSYMETEEGKDAMEKIQNILVETLKSINSVYQNIEE